MFFVTIVQTIPHSLYSLRVNLLYLPAECLDGQFADPNDEFGYFDCTHGTAVKKSCPVRHRWNQQEKKCSKTKLCKLHKLNCFKYCTLKILF